MSLNAQAIAVSGYGYGAQLIAVSGYGEVAQGAAEEVQAGASGGMLPRMRARKKRLHDDEDVLILF